MISFKQSTLTFESTSVMKYDLEFKTIRDLYIFRKSFEGGGSGPSTKGIVYSLCNLLAKERGWDLDAYSKFEAEVDVHMEELIDMGLPEQCEPMIRSKIEELLNRGDK
jgi:hypothetical protein